jgi:5-hydroxyisourate hydrolase-like protein (transthyretin family)
VSIWNIKAKSIYGKVIDQYNNVISNAVIQIYKNKEEGKEILAETKANENGFFEIANFKSGKYMIRAYADGFTYSYGSLKLKKSLKQARTEEIIFTLVTYGECSGKVEVNKISSEK